MLKKTYLVNLSFVWIGPADANAALGLENNYT